MAEIDRSRDFAQKCASLWHALSGVWILISISQRETRVEKAEARKMRRINVSIVDGSCRPGHISLKSHELYIACFFKLS